MIHVNMPSNIALIKYMGKNANQAPINSSLSLTIAHLYSSLTFKPANSDQLITDVTLKPGGKENFIHHFQWLKSIFNIKDHFHILSENNFPSGAGLASSASAYSALTKGTYLISQKLQTHSPLSMEEIARLSAKGSGSSIRSFFEPYCIWTKDGARAIGENWPKLESCVAIIDAGHKKISSSEAHKRVISCPDIQERINRANDRLSQLIRAFDQANWSSIYHICKDEFLDMHHLFHSCQAPFKYITSDSEELISQADIIVKQGTKLIITMDAGPNVHFLYPPESQDAIQSLVNQYQKFPWRFSRV
jgi:diphosphomevalonate decarboxylase